MIDISIVIPVFNEGNSLWVLCERIYNTLSPKFDNFEIILVDDRSEDDSWEVMKNIAKEKKEIKIVRLSRNFGQHSALTAGLSLTIGKYIVMMDCDQQDAPEYIPDLYNELMRTNVQIVYARRMNRRHRTLSIWASIAINYILSKLSGYEYNPLIGTYRIMRRLVVESYLSLPEKNRFIGGMFNWLGFSTSYLDVEHQHRYKGKSNYTFRRQLKLARLGILSSSTKLLSISTYLGITLSAFSFCYGTYRIIMKFLYEIPVGYTSIIIAIFFTSGVIMLILGIIGEYLREIFEEIKARPNFIVEEKHNF